jgi:hypothetical protein
MDEGLAMARVAGEEVALHRLLVDAADVLGDGKGVAGIVVDAGDAQDQGGNRSALLPDHLFRLDLGARVVPRRIRRRRFGDRPLFLVHRLHDEQAAREDELLHGKRPQGAQEAARALHGQIAIERAGRAREVVVGREVDDAGGGEPRRVGGNPVEGALHGIVTREIALDELGAGGHLAWGLDVQGEHRVVGGEGLHGSRADEAGAAGDDDGGADHLEPFCAGSRSSSARTSSSVVWPNSS